MRGRAWALGVVALVLFVAGCSNKGGRAGKVEVVLSEKLKAKGVALVDWRYSPSEKSFGVKLKASEPVEKQTYIVINGPGLSRIGSPVPVGERINKGDWIDFGGSKALGNPFENFPESGTITIDVR